MLSIGFLDTDLYHFLSWFFIYSILGWFVESCYMSYCNKKLSNRGFIFGPICPIYGVGALFVYYTLQKFAGNYIVLYFMGTCLATSLEYLTAKLMIRCFGFVWWDYTNKPFNYKGIVCLESTIAWGFYTVFEFLFLHNAVSFLVDSYPRQWGEYALIFVMFYFAADFSYCLFRASKGQVRICENDIMSVEEI